MMELVNKQHHNVTLKDNVLMEKKDVQMVLVNHYYLIVELKLPVQF